MSRVGEFLLYTPDAFKVNLEAIESEGVSINFSYTSAFWYNVIVYCVMFALLSTSYSVQLFQSIIPALKVIREQELANFMCQVASTVNSLYISSTSIYAISKLSFYGDSVEGVTCFLKLCQMMVAYVIMDTYYKTQRAGQSVSWIIPHHVASLVVCLAACLDCEYLLEKYLLSLMECSNPFINFRIMFSILSYPKCTIAYKVNAVLMTFSFLIVRVLPSFYFIPRGFYILMFMTDYSNMQMIMFLSYLVISALNYYWFYRMLRGVWAAVTGGKIE